MNYNLVPRVLRLFGQRVGARRDSEEFKKFKFFDWLLCFSSVKASIVLPQKSCGNKIPCTRPVPQSRTQSPQAFWSAGRRQERLWDNGISYPRKRGIPVFVRMLKIKTEVKCPKMAVVLMFSGLKVLSGLESVRESQS